MAAQGPPDERDGAGKGHGLQDDPSWDVPDLLEPAPQTRPTLDRLGGAVAALAQDVEDAQSGLELDLELVSSDAHRAASEAETDVLRDTPRAIPFESDAQMAPAAALVECGRVSETTPTAAGRSTADHVPMAVAPPGPGPAAGAASLSRWGRGPVISACLLGSALLLSLASRIYAAVSGQETNTGWLAGLLLVGAVLPLGWQWWKRSLGR
jgi:hypothetical protein